jgi:hypothetical protein
VKSLILIAGAVVVLILATLGWVHFGAKTQAATPTPAVAIVPAPAPPGSQEASPQWITEFDRLDEMNNEFQARKVGAMERYIQRIESEKDAAQRGLDEYQLENDLIVGINNRLGSQIPQGFTFDPMSRRFIPKPVAPVVPSAPVKK